MTRNGIHYVFRELQSDDNFEAAGIPILHGDAVVAGFRNGDTIPFHYGPYFRGGQGRRADMHEGIAFDRDGKRFPWEPKSSFWES
jgi:hypothetical protein